MIVAPTEGAPVLTVQEAADYLRISRGLAFAPSGTAACPACGSAGGSSSPAGSSRRCSTATHRRPEAEDPLTSPAAAGPARAALPPARGRRPAVSARR